MAANEHWKCWVKFAQSNVLTLHITYCMSQLKDASICVTGKRGSGVRGARSRRGMGPPPPGSLNSNLSDNLCIA